MVSFWYDGGYDEKVFEPVFGIAIAVESFRRAAAAVVFRSRFASPVPPHCISMRYQLIFIAAENIDQPFVGYFRKYNALAISSVMPVMRGMTNPGWIVQT